METVDVKFIGGSMSGVTLTLEANEFQDGDLLKFHGDTYLMKKGRGYFVSTLGDNFKGRNPGGHLKAAPIAA